MKYDWLLFDLDNTILDFDKGMRYALEKTFLDYNIPTDEHHYATYYKANKQCWVDLEQGKITQDRLRTLRMELFLSAIESDTDPLHFTEAYHTNLASKIFYLDNAETLVKNWSTQFKMALVTNGLKEIQRGRLSKTDLNEHFKTIVISDEIGVSKPHQGFFDHVFQKINFPPKDRVMIIGDSLSSDIKGGNDYGIHTCWLNPKGKVIPENNTPTYTIKKLQGLAEIIGC